ncbi:MAG: gamma-glutamylcyclotransferase [Alphaproteobacteria bacterium]|nr:gamma-glutamylcyclotransferase [Alphaproteobacteria bacterium]
MTKKIELSAADRDRVDEALREYMKVESAADREEIIDTMEQEGALYSFGFGSLIKDPHVSGLKRYNDFVLKGQVARFNCAFTFYGGTKNLPSLMYGLEPDENGLTPGVVDEKPLIEDGKPMSVDGIVTFIREFGVRENPPGNPIYKIRFVRVENPEGMTKLAVACVTDPDGPLFVGDKLTIDQKAILIANEWGTQLNPRDKSAQNKPGQRTIASYLYDVIDARLKCGFPVEAPLWELLRKVNYYRAQMHPDKREFLELMESGIGQNEPGKAQRQNDELIEGFKGKSLQGIYRTLYQRHRNFRKEVYGAAEGKQLSAERYATLLWSARAGLQDALGVKPDDMVLASVDRFKGLMPELLSGFVPDPA